MSLATRCTHCGTIFKVVQDQLKVSEGWVRCGRCNEVFNALPALFDLDTEAPPPRPTPPPAQNPVASQPQSTPHSTPRTAPAPTPQATPRPVSQTPAAPPAPASSAAAPVRTPPPARATPLADLPSAPPRQPVVTPGLAARPAPPAPPVTPAAAPLSALPSAPVPPVPPEPPTRLTVRGVDDFELDTSVPLPGRDTEPMEHDSGGGPLSLPMTNEADALDSRYLLPSSRSKRPAVRRVRGPEFADAEFPSDAMLDAEEDWLLEPTPMPSTAPPSLARLGQSGAPAAGHDTPPPAPSSSQAVSAPAAPTAVPPTSADAAAPAGLALPPIEEDGPTTLPSRFADDDAPAPAADAQAQPGDAPAPTEAELLARRTSERASSRDRKGRRSGRDTQPPTPEFLRQARRQAMWRHPGTRGLLSGLSLALLLTLGAQVLHQQRDWVAAREPALRPWLVQWCAWAQCQLGLPRNLEAFQVDHATLVRAESEGPDRYRLSLVVRSSTATELAWPAVDLVLNDRNGQVLARRTLPVRAADWQAEAPAASAAGVPPPPGMPARASGTLSWSLQLVGLDPAGYTAELFYP